MDIEGWIYDRDRKSFTRQEGDVTLLVASFDGLNWGYTRWRRGVCLGGEYRSAWTPMDACDAAVAS